MSTGEEISGGTAAEIAESVRTLVDRGDLAPGDPLPPVRALAARLGIHRNTAVAAYRTLAGAGIVVTQGRAGTRVAPVPAPAPSPAPAAACTCTRVAPVPAVACAGALSTCPYPLGWSG